MEEEEEEEMGVEAQDDNSDTMAEEALSYVQTALTRRRRRRVCSCSSQTDLRHLTHSFSSPTPGTGSPTTSLLGFNILGR